MSTLSLTNSTVSNNTAIFSGPGSGIYNPNGATLILTNTIIAKNHGGSECSGTGGWSVTSLGHNLDSDGTCGLDGTGDLSNTDPLLGPLQDNGGPTLTHALLPDSPAIDSGDDAVLGSPHNLTTDQRGFPRLLGAHLDIGAYEAEPPQSGTLTVTKTGDTNDGFCGVLDCSLREAIASDDSGDTIVIPTGVYTLTSGLELAIAKSLTLSGAGSGDTIIQAATGSGIATSRVFNIAGGNVVISDVTIWYGNTSGSGGGGGVFNSGTLTLINSTISNNPASNGSCCAGGGIYNEGTLTLTNSTVNDNEGLVAAGIFNSGTLTITNSSLSGNTATFCCGAGILNRGTLSLTNSSIYGNESANSGGAIYNEGTLAITDTTISGNIAAFGGGITNYITGTTTLINSTISGNTVHGPGYGGGIDNFSGGTITLINSTVSNNTADSGGGGIRNIGTVALTNTTVRHNMAGTIGGGIFNGGTMTVTNSNISDNTAISNGGGIYNGGGATVTLDNSTVSGNSTLSASGIFNRGTMTVTNSTVIGNTATDDGGGIFNDGTLSVTNSTISANVAPSDGGGVFNRGVMTVTNSTISHNTGGELGAGIMNGNFSTLILTNSTVSNNTSAFQGGGVCNDGTLTITNTTISSNTATNSNGGGIFNSGDGTMYLNNTIIASNTALNGPDCTGSPTSLGHNLIGTSDGCSFTPITGDLVDIDPLLGSLQDNHGPTFTHALLPGSPAIDRIPVAACVVPTDQRGVARPQGAACDIGAFEVVLGDANGDGVVNTDDLRIVMAAFGSSPPSDHRADLNGDGVVDIHDLVLVAYNLGFGNP